MAISEYVLIPRFPDVADYRHLRAAAGLTQKTPEAAAAGLAGTWFGVSMLCGNEVVGMGRIVGDGGCFFQLVDVAIAPAHQRRGLGTRIMHALVEHVREHAPPSANVTLFADGTAGELYERFGFTLSAPKSTGMHLRW